MARQHATPVLLTDDGSIALTQLGTLAGVDAVSEAAIQQLVHEHPSCLPISEIDPLFSNPVPVCMELNTSAGPIDNFMITPTGLPVLVECKLWRNPEGRREVVGQIIDYAKELARWSSSDLQREANRRLGTSGNALLELVRHAGHEVDETEFNDALTNNLRRGRFLLLIVGDGIREGVEAISEYLQAHAGLHFTLGLVELPIFITPDGKRFIAPRTLAKTIAITREVIAAPEDFIVRDGIEDERSETDMMSDEDAARKRFMEEVVVDLVLDDPDQPRPKVTPKGWLYLYMPAPASSCWIGVLYKRGGSEVGVRLTSNTGTLGEAAIRASVQNWCEIEQQLGGKPELEELKLGRFQVHEFLSTTDRTAAIAWVRERLNSYVSVFRPRIRDAVEALKDSD